MRSLGWALIHFDWYSLRRGNLDTHKDTSGTPAQRTAECMHVEKRPSEDIARRLSSASQGESPQKNQLC